LVIARERRCAATSDGTVTTQESGSPEDPLGDAACVALAALMGIAAEEYCGGGERSPVVTGALVATALRRIPIPPAELNVQPPNGRTLVNFATNFYTDRDEFSRVVRLLGRRVELRITPAQFTWFFDDGESTTTSTPGSPYPHLDVTHEYLTKGGVSPRVDTTYSAVFRVGTGAWQPVPGSVTIPGASVALNVVEASPILVGYN
jgi:hypothetical protein